jgi:hypothetical protein
MKPHLYLLLHNRESGKGLIIIPAGHVKLKQVAGACETVVVARGVFVGQGVVLGGKTVVQGLGKAVCPGLNGGAADGALENFPNFFDAATLF